MAYFANGTEGDMFFDQYCVRCVHCGGCPVWDLHLTWNYEQVMGRDDEEITSEKQTKTTVLNWLMPRNEGKNTCSMFYPAPVPLLPDENRQTITIATTGDGTREVEACVHGNFAVHRTLASGKAVARTFSVTHLPTRMAMPVDLGLDDAINLAKRLAELDVGSDFTEIGSPEHRAFAEVARRIVEEYR